MTIRLFYTTSYRVYVIVPNFENSVYLKLIPLSPTAKFKEATVCLFTEARDVSKVPKSKHLKISTLCCLSKVKHGLITAVLNVK